MRLKLNIKNLTFEGEVEILRDLLPTLSGTVGILGNGQANGHIAEHVPALAAAGSVATAAAQDVGDEYMGAEQSIPAPAHDELSTPKPRKPRRQRKPKPEPAEEAGSIKINTGRREQSDLIAFVRKRGQVDKVAVAEHFGITKAAAYQRLWGLIARGQLVNTGRGMFKVSDGADE